MQREKIQVLLVDTLYFALGSILYGLGLYTFASQSGFATGGISGIALMINHFTSWPIGLLTILLNIPLALVSFRVIGFRFILKSAWAILISSLFLDLVFPRFPVYAQNPLLAAMFTGVFMGAGLALIYMRGASTGGSDFIVLSVRKRRPHFSVGQLTLALDCVIILAGGFVYDNVDAILYGLVAAFATSRMMDSVLYGAGSSKLALIISSKGHQVAQAILVEVGRGATLMDVTGAYTGDPKTMVVCACSKNQIIKIKKITEREDPGALFMVTEAGEVVGEGFVPPPIPGNN